MTSTLQLIPTTLSANEKVATVGEITLKVDEVVEYITSDGRFKSSGVIDKFWLIDPKDMKSVWMKIRDVNGAEDQIISLRNWHDYLKRGIIKN